MTAKKHEDAILSFNFRKNGFNELTLTKKRFKYKRIERTSIFSTTIQTVFDVPINDIKDVWRHVGLIASTLIIEVLIKKEGDDTKERNMFKFKMDDATCQKWADTISEMVS